MTQTNRLFKWFKQTIELAFIIIAIASITLWLFTGYQTQGQTNTNKFSDTVLQHIHDLADRREAQALMPYLRDENLNYRGEALLCLGSVQASGIADSIADAMQSEIDGIRMAGAFALGQTYDESAAQLIRRLIEEEKKPLVLGMLYDALGKTGSDADLAWLGSQNLDLQQTEGQAMGIFRFGLREITNTNGNERMLAMCASGSSLAGLSYASYFLGRYAPVEWLQQHKIEIRQLFDRERSDVIRAQLIKAVIKAEDEDAWPLAEQLLKDDVDYRIKVSILSSLAFLPWNKANKLVYNLAVGSNVALAAAASEAIKIHAVYTDLQMHLNAIDKAQSWRSRATLLSKALQLVNGKKGLTKKLEKQLFAYYDLAGTDTEKAWLIKVLAGDPTQYQFVEEQLVKAQSPVLATAAVETLGMMRQSKSFTSDLEADFLRLFKRAIQSGDVPAVSLSAAILSDPALNYKELITDTEFLKTALNRAQDPSKVEARNALILALAYFLDKQVPSLPPPSYNHPIDWDRVIQIDPKQQLAIITDKGEIVVQLNVNWCPGTVSAFLELVESGYFNNKSFHRMVPNFVLQDGCPRGDGWGSPPFTLRSEFSPAPFVEGTLGMASAGKDTEGSQWYITHSPTPHLDAKYTNFGYVVAGMDVVHVLDVGDVIRKIEIIKD